MHGGLSGVVKRTFGLDCRKITPGRDAQRESHRGASHSSRHHSSGGCRECSRLRDVKLSPMPLRRRHREDGSKAQADVLRGVRLEPCSFKRARRRFDVVDIIAHNLLALRVPEHDAFACLTARIRLCIDGNVAR